MENNTVTEKTYKQFCEEHPICQNFHTGLWGYERYLDGFNLNSARYGSKSTAQRARKAAWERKQEIDRRLAAGESGTSIMLDMESRGLY